MTVTTGTPISMSDIKSGTGLSANDLGSYYRGTTNAGWTPASGAISFNDLRGAWAKAGPRDGYTSVGMSYANTMRTEYGGYYYYYYTMNNNAYYRGNVWTIDNIGSTYPGGGVTAARCVQTSGNETYATLPMGAIGDTGGVERFVGVSSSCSLSGWYYYYNKKSLEMIAHQSGIGIDGNSWGVYDWVGGGIGGWINYFNSHPNGYAFGVRINTSGTAYVGKYYVGNFGGSSAPAAITVSEEWSITGSSYVYGRHRQTHLNGSASSEITGGVNYTFYSQYVYYKNAYEAVSYNSISNGTGFKNAGNQGWT